MMNQNKSPYATRKFVPKPIRPSIGIREIWLPQFHVDKCQHDPNYFTDPTRDPSDPRPLETENFKIVIPQKLPQWVRRKNPTI